MTGLGVVERASGQLASGQLGGGRSRVVRGARVPDVNQCLLVGAVVRRPRVVRGVLEVTLAGQVVTADGVVLPWYHRVVLDSELEPAAGEVWRVMGALEQVKFRSPDGGARSIVRLQGSSAGRVENCAGRVVVQEDSDGGRFFLEGGENRVRLSGNLTRAAESSVGPSGDRLTRLNLAVEGAAGRKDFFLLKAWRDQSVLVSELGKGARVGVNGALLSERFEQRGLTVRNQVVVEVTASNTSGKRV